MANKALQYNVTSLLNGKHGIGLQAISTASCNFILSSQLSNHPDLKMPTVKVVTPDELRDIVNFGEFVKVEPIKLSKLVDGVMATCGLIKDIAEYKDVSTSGSVSRPYAWMTEKVRTPASAITNRYKWLSDNTAKTAGIQATLLKMPNAQEIEQKARDRSIAQNQERIAYAIAQVNSLTHLGLLKEDSSKLVDILVELDGEAYDIMAITRASALAEVARATARLLKGDFTRIDEEVAIFASA